MAGRQFTIGAVAGAHGIKGDIRVFPMTDDIKRFELLTEITVDLNEKGGGASKFEIDKIWYHKKFVMLKLRGVDTMSAAEALKGASIKIDEENALPLSENEYYIRDLVGITVYTDEGEELGNITDVFATGANDVYEIEKKLYIPAIKDCVLDVDIKSKKMTVKLLEGLR